MSTDIRVPTLQGPRYYTEIVRPAFVFLVPYTPQVPVCTMLWQNLNTKRQTKTLTLPLIDTVSGTSRVVSVQCETGGAMETYWETTQDMTGLKQSDHPCNLDPPACIKPAPVADPYDAITTASSGPVQPTRNVFTSLLYKLRSPKKKSLGTSDPCNTTQEEIGDDEIPALKLLRTAMHIEESVRAYQVIISRYCRVSPGKSPVIFCISFSFGRCIRGNNILSCRCPEPEGDGGYDHGLTLTIE